MLFTQAIFLNNLIKGFVLLLTNILASSLCFLSALNYSSTIEIKKERNNLVVIENISNNNTSSNRALLKAILRQNSEIDARILSIAWVESRINIKVKRGDRGKACGIFQIHARYSLPYFRRKRGFNGWVELKEKRSIEKECKRLENVNYSVKTMTRYLEIMDKKDIHPCHHNSGFKGKCNSWYKKRIDFWTYFFEISKLSCKYPVFNNFLGLKKGENKNKRILRLAIDIMKKDDLMPRK